MFYSLLHFELFKQFSVLSQNILWSVDHRQGAWEAALMIVIKITPTAMMAMVYSLTALYCSLPSQHLTQPQARFLISGRGEYYFACLNEDWSGFEGGRILLVGIRW